MDTAFIKIPELAAFIVQRVVINQTIDFIHVQVRISLTHDNLNDIMQFEQV